MSFKTLRDIDVKGKKVLLRADLNVPAKDGRVTDTTRIDRLKPTIDYLCDKGAFVIVLSHFGRPKGGPEPEFSLAFLPPALKAGWGRDVAFVPASTGEPVKTAIAGMKPGGILLLENLRFHKGEEANDPAFVRELAALGDLYVNDAFSAAHRAHASTEGLAHLLPTAAGLLMEEELKALNAALENPARPVMALVGGAKISTKLDLLGNLVGKVDMLVLGGGMANTFLAAQGVDVKKSLCEKDMLDNARLIMDKAKKQGCEIILPVDGVAADAFSATAKTTVTAADKIPEGTMILDIGPQSAAHIVEKLKGCKTAVWNGPLGAFEIKPFDKGTAEVAQAVAALTAQGKLVSVAGGGDTVAALEAAGVTEKMSYVSTAGGAFLEWMEGKALPGVAALSAYRNAA